MKEKKSNLYVVSKLNLLDTFCRKVILTILASNSNNFYIERFSIPIVSWKRYIIRQFYLNRILPFSSALSKNVQRRERRMQRIMQLFTTHLIFSVGTSPFASLYILYIFELVIKIFDSIAFHFIRAIFENKGITLWSYFVIVCRNCWYVVEFKAYLKYNQNFIVTM